MDDRFDCVLSGERKIHALGDRRFELPADTFAFTARLKIRDDREMAKSPFHLDLRMHRGRRPSSPDDAAPAAERDRAFRRIILSIPSGRVSTYGRVAAAAGYPRYHRAVAHLLRTDPPDQLPWHRVLGAGGEIKLPGDAATEQRARLVLEGVRFHGGRVDMEEFEYSIRSWETLD